MNNFFLRRLDETMWTHKLKAQSSALRPWACFDSLTRSLRGASAGRLRSGLLRREAPQVPLSVPLPGAARRWPARNILGLQPKGCSTFATCILRASGAGQRSLQLAHQEMPGQRFFLGAGDALLFTSLFLTLIHLRRLRCDVCCRLLSAISVDGCCDRCDTFFFYRFTRI